MTNPNDPAFPAMPYDEDGNPLPHNPGLTKREYAAIQIINGLASNRTVTDNLTLDNIDLIVRKGRIIADALLAELGREK